MSETLEESNHVNPWSKDEEITKKALNWALSTVTIMKDLKVDYSAVLNHPSSDGKEMQHALEHIVEPNNIRILTREEFLDKLSHGQIDYSCIDGRSVTEDNGKPVVHVAGDAFGLYILAPMEALSDLGISKDLDETIVEQFLTKNAIRPTSHSGSHSHGDDSIISCDCGHCKTNGTHLDANLLALANTYYENPVQLVGDHKEKAIIISADKDHIVLVDTTNELMPDHTSTQAEHQVFWNDAGAIELCIEYYADSLASIASHVSGQTYTSDQIASAWKSAYNTQLGRTVQALKSSKPLADAGKVFTLSIKDNGEFVLAS